MPVIYIPSTDTGAVTLSYLQSHYPSNTTLERVVSTATATAISVLNRSITSQLAILNGVDDDLQANDILEAEQIATINTAVASFTESQAQIITSAGDIQSLKISRSQDEAHLVALQQETTDLGINTSSALTGFANTLTSVQSNIATNTANITANSNKLLTDEVLISSNTTAVKAVSDKLILDEALIATANTNISSLQADVTAVQSIVTTSLDSIASNTTDIKVVKDQQALDAHTLTTTSLAVSTLQNDVSLQTSRAVTSETTITNNLALEVTRAKDSEANISAGVLTETTRALGIESTLNTRLTNEVFRAIGQEGTLSTQITTEVTRAKGAEDSLKQSIPTFYEYKIGGWWNGAFNNPICFIRFHRVGNLVVLFMHHFLIAPVQGGEYAETGFNQLAPSWALPLEVVALPANLYTNHNHQPGVVTINTSGHITMKLSGGAPWIAGTLSGIAMNTSVSYLVEIGYAR